MSKIKRDFKIMSRMKTFVIWAILIPIIAIGQFYLFKNGLLSPMVKGIEIQLLGGNYIKNVDKYIVKLGDTVEISAGDYIIVPGYAKKPSIWFNVLDDSKTVSITNGNKLKGLKVGYSSIGVMKKNRVLKKANIKVVNPSVQDLYMDFNKKLMYYGDSAQIESSVKVLDYKSLEKGNKPIFTSSNEKVLKVEGDTVKAVGVGTAKITAKYNKNEVQASFDILSRVDKIDMPDKIDIELKEKKNISPVITASPDNSHLPDISYKIVGVKRKSDRCIKMNDKGIISGKKIGSEKILVRCGNITKTVTVNVKRQSTPNIEIEGLKAEPVDDSKFVLLWEKADGIDVYDIYYRPAGEREYRNISTVRYYQNPSSPADYEGGIIPVHETLLKGNRGDSYYVVGKLDGEETKRSKVIVYPEP